MLAPTDGTASGHEGCKKKPKGIPINYATSRAAAIGQQVLVFEAATGHGIDEAFDRRLGAKSRGASSASAARALKAIRRPRWR
jgi:hypothetical protein